MDARHFRGAEELPLCHFRRRWWLQASQFARGQVYSHRLPRVLRRADAGSDPHGQRNEKRKLRLQSQTLLSLFRVDRHESYQDTFVTNRTNKVERTRSQSEVSWVSCLQLFWCSSR